MERIFTKSTKLFLVILIVLSGINISMLNLHAEDLLVNEGFESGNLTSWSIANPGKFKITNQSENVYEGNYALEINAVSQTWDSAMRSVPVQSDYKYEISFYAKGTSNVIFKALNATGAMSLVDKTTNNKPDEWTMYKYEFNSKNNEQIALYFSDTIGQVFIDNITLKAVEAAPPKQYGVLNGNFETGDLSNWNDSMTQSMFSVVDGNDGKVLFSNTPTQDWGIMLTQTIDIRKSTEYMIELDKDGADVYYKLVSTDWSTTFVEGNVDTQSFATYSSEVFNSGNREQAILIIYSTNGPAYMDNIKLRPFVIQPDHSRAVVNATGVESNFSLVDTNATMKTKSLFSYLKEVGQEYLIFGQQYNNTQAIVQKDGIISDTYHTVGAYAGISGFDVIDIKGGFNSTLSSVKSAYNEGSIITLCDHMPNFSAANGAGPWTDMTPTIEHIFPGGKDNQAFTERLDMIADFANQAVDSEGTKIPIIFRPFHENSGMWFWWGVSNTTKDQFVNLWRYTVEYLRDEKGVDNFLYAYSPNGHFSSETDYLSRYPGDGYVDIIGFDIYHDYPTYDSNWMNLVKQDAQIAVNIANDKNKIAAVTEIGLRYDGNNGLAVEDNAMKDWFSIVHDTFMNDPIAKQVAYMMTWRNGDKNHFWVPYDDGEGDRHEMANDFTKLYNQPDVIFADRVGNVGALTPTVIDRENHLYIMTPTLGEEVAGEYIVRVGFSGDKNQVSNMTITLNGREYETTRNGLYFEAVVNTNLLEDGNYELVATANNGVYQVSKIISILNNPENESKNVAIIDNFDSYFGNSDLLNEKYHRNANGDINELRLIPSPFTRTRSSEDYALSFKYNVATGGPGYSGASKTLNYDITTLDSTGISLWFQGDGKGQDILIQLNAPNTFEAHFNELSTFNQTSTAPQFIEIPWSAFKQKGHTSEIDFSNIQTFAIYVNGSGVENSTLIFDDIQFIYEPKESPKKDINQAQIIVPEVVFDGKHKEPEINVLYDDKQLEKGVDYTLRYEDNINAGNALVIVTGIGEYEGEKTQTFVIKKAKHTINSSELIEVEFKKDGVYNLNVESTSDRLLYSLTPTSQKDVATVTIQGQVKMMNPGEVKIVITAPVEDNYEGTILEVTLVLKAKETNPSNTISNKLKEEQVGHTNIVSDKVVQTSDGSENEKFIIMGVLSLFILISLVSLKKKTLFTIFESN